MIKRQIMRLVQKTLGVALGDVAAASVAYRSSVIDKHLQEVRERMPENPAASGLSVYSQNEEDGIISGIFKSMAVMAPKFMEFGVHITENNSLNILLNGGRGAWIDKGLTPFKKTARENDKLLLVDRYIDINNIYTICEEVKAFLAIDSFLDLDLVSLDLDGNDYYLIEEVVSKGVRPKVFCLEYNAKFPPPQKTKITYNAAHRWLNNDDYYGCSLQAYVDLLAPFRYHLLCCNITGSNCFFVREDVVGAFNIRPVTELYQPPRPFLSPFPKGASPSIKYLKSIL